MITRAAPIALLANLEAQRYPQPIHVSDDAREAAWQPAKRPFVCFASLPLLSHRPCHRGGCAKSRVAGMAWAR